MLATARQSTGGRVLAVFQPHLFTRTDQFLTEFLDALGAADRAWVEPVYPARQDPADYQHVPARLEREAAARGAQLDMSPGREELAAHLAEIAGLEDTVMLIGAGDVTLLADLLVAWPKPRLDPRPGATHSSGAVGSWSNAPEAAARRRPLGPSRAAGSPHS